MGPGYHNAPASIRAGPGYHNAPASVRAGPGYHNAPASVTKTLALRSGPICSSSLLLLPPPPCSNRKQETGSGPRQSTDPASLSEGGQLLVSPVDPPVHRASRGCRTTSRVGRGHQAVPRDSSRSLVSCSLVRCSLVRCSLSFSHNAAAPASTAPPLSSTVRSALRHEPLYPASLCHGRGSGSLALADIDFRSEVLSWTAGGQGVRGGLGRRTHQARESGEAGEEDPPG